MMLVLSGLHPFGLTLDRLPKTFDRKAFEAYWSTQPGAVARRYGQFATAIAPLQIEAARLFAAGRLRRDDASFAALTRTTLADLGPTFIKIGQILSVREDILGPVWAAELAKLQDGVEAFDGEEAVAAVLSSFGSDDFSSIELEPVAAASIAQVHRGVYKGSDVAIKILRPGVVGQVAVDLCVLLRASELLATWAPRVLPSNRIDWRALLLGLASALWEEVNLEGEAERQRRFAANMASVPRVTVPRVLVSTREVMVSEWAEGIPLRQIDSARVLRAAQALMRDAYCQSMFVDAYFHADCHGGNLLWLPDATRAGGRGKGVAAMVDDDDETAGSAVEVALASPAAATGAEGGARGSSRGGTTGGGEALGATGERKPRSSSGGGSTSSWRWSGSKAVRPKSGGVLYGSRSLRSVVDECASTLPSLPEWRPRSM